MLSAPPPPPPPPSGQCPIDNQFTRLPPPPPPPQPPPMGRPSPAFLPHQLRHRPPMPMRHPMHMGPRPNSNPGGMPHFQAPPPPPMMGGSGPGGPPPHHIPGPMMMPPQRPFMPGPTGGMFNPGQQSQQDPLSTNINIEKPKVVYSAPPTCKNQKLEPTRMSDSHVGTIAGQSSSATVSSTSSATSVSSSVGQFQSNDQTHSMTNEGGTEDEIMGMDASVDPDGSGQQKKEKKEKKRKFIRTAAGQIWEDHTLSEWVTGKFIVNKNKLFFVVYLVLTLIVQITTSFNECFVLIQNWLVSFGYICQEIPYFNISYSCHLDLTCHGVIISHSFEMRFFVSKVKFVFNFWIHNCNWSYLVLEMFQPFGCILFEINFYYHMNHDKFRQFLTFICDWDLNILLVIQSTDNFPFENCLGSIWNYLVFLYIL